MNSKSLSKIKTVFKSINDKLAFLQDPQTFKRGKSLTPEKIQKNIDALEADQSSFEKDQRKINNSVEKKLNYLEQAIEESQSIRPQQIVPKAPRINDAKPIEQNEEALKNINVKYNPDAKRYQETTGKMRFVGHEEVANRLQQNQPALGKDEEKSLFESINENLIEANTSLKNIVKSLTSDQVPTTEEPKKKDATPVDDKGKPIDKDEGGGGGIWAALGLTLFAFLPLLIKLAKDFIKKMQEKLRTFLVPVFDFILEDVKPFFMETLPDFFLDTLPKFFQEKFTTVKSYLEDFMDNVKIFISSIKKGVGEALVSVGKLLPGNMGDSIQQFGQGMIDEADKDISAAEDRKAGRQEERDKQEKLKIFKDQVEDEAKKFLERNKNFKSYKITTDEEKGSVYVEYIGGSSTQMDVFDRDKSIENGTLIRRGPAAKDSDKKDAEPATDSGTTGTTPDATPEKSSEGSTPAPAATPSGGPGASGGGSGGADAVPATGGGEGGESAGTPAAAGGGESSGTPATETPQAQLQAPEASSSGDQITQGTKEATDPSIGRNKASQGSNVIQLNAGSSKGFDLKEGKPHDINDVPDPTPMLGSLADQLFYLRA